MISDRCPKRFAKQLREIVVTFLGAGRFLRKHLFVADDNSLLSDRLIIRLSFSQNTAFSYIIHFGQVLETQHQIDNHKRYL